MKMDEGGKRGAERRTEAELWRGGQRERRRKFTDVLLQKIFKI